MAISQRSLRSKTGCFPCRHRRVKCDEQTPTCRSCQRNNLDCSWPSNSQLLDRRTKHGRYAARPSGSFLASFDRQHLPVLGTGRIKPEEVSILTHFTEQVMPQLSHRHAAEQFRDPRYLLAMSSRSTALMKAIIAYSAMDLASSKAEYRQIALESYSNSVQRLRNDLAGEHQPLTEEPLLATVVLLCLFEDLVDTTQHENIVAHLPAIKSLLGNQVVRGEAPQLIQAFHRLCVETLLYYNVVLLLLDSSHFSSLCSLLDQVDYGILIPDSDTVADRPDGTASKQPVLGTSYRFYLLVAAIIRLARLPLQSWTDSGQLWLQLDGDLQRWEAIFSYERQAEVRNAPAHLAMKALRALLIMTDSRISGVSQEQQLVAIKARALSHLSGGFRTAPVTKYAVWQMIIIGSLLHDAGEVYMFQEILNGVYRRQPSVLVASALRLLKRLWADTQCQRLSLTPCLDGMRRLFIQPQ